MPVNMPAEPKQAFVRRMFDDISGKYDFLNTILSFGQDNRWRKMAITEIPSDGLIIDLCAGGGEMAREILSRKDFKGEVIITDISRGMLSLIKRNLPSKFLGRYYPVICDAEKLPFRSQIASGSVSAFCLRNLSDLTAFTNEVRRVLKIEGMACHLEIAHPEMKILSIPFEFYFYKLSPLIARLFTSKSYAYRYLPASLKGFPPQNDVVTILGENWASALYKNIMGGMAAIYSLRKGK
jgi:demethylmenaquinone methyltransferase / 2-methoxy-6-polyprenyl-1,4-benzoquinol methylase